MEELTICKASLINAVTYYEIPNVNDLLLFISYYRKI